MQGTHYFLNINTGRRVARNNWTALPMPNEVIHTVHRLAAASRKYKGIVFTDSKGNIIDDNNPDDNDENNQSAEITGVGSTHYNNTGTETTRTGNTTNNVDDTNNNITEVGNINTYNADDANDNFTGVGNMNNIGNSEIEPEDLPVPNLQERHTTHETDETDEDYTHERPTVHEREAIE